MGARLIHVSTDYVFSGEGDAPLDESCPIGPVSAYGRTKALGEEYVRCFCHRFFIVRTAWLYGYNGKNFVKTMVNAGKKFGKLEVVNDQLGNPTNAEDLAHHLSLIHIWCRSPTRSPWASWPAASSRPPATSSRS